MLDPPATQPAADVRADAKPMVDPSKPPIFADLSQGSEGFMKRNANRQAQRALGFADLTPVTNTSRPSRPALVATRFEKQNFASLSSPIAAASTVTDASPAPDAAEFDRVVVTATRTERAIADVPNTVDVIDRARMDTLLVRDIADLFRYEPGVTVGNSFGRFGLGALLPVRVRTLLLIPRPARLQELIGQGCAVVASTHPASPLVRGPSGRLPANHVMALVGADAERDEVRLRNPWRPD